MKKELTFERRMSKFETMKNGRMLQEIQNIKKELSMLRIRQEHLEDSLLTADDTKALKEARDDLKNKKTVSLSEMKKKLNM